MYPSVKKDGEPKTEMGCSKDNVITFHDMFAIYSPDDERYNKDTKGEFYAYQTKLNRVNRMISTLSNIIDIAEKKHKEENFDADTIKPDRKNTIFRMSTSEFSFYTHETPLSLQEFIKLKSWMYHRALMLPCNLHFAFSSVALGLPDGTLQNITFYLQCGPSAELRTFEKVAISDVDLKYKGYKYDPEYYYPYDRVAQLEKKGGIFQISTDGGLSAWVAVDICLEHLDALAIRKLESILEAQSEQSDISVSHLIISNRVQINASFLISDNFTHITPDDFERGQWKVNDEKFGSSSRLPQIKRNNACYELETLRNSGFGNAPFIIENGAPMRVSKRK